VELTAEIPEDALQIARAAHETNRAFCESIGDYSQPRWSAAPNWQRVSALNGVLFHLSNLRAGVEPSPEASHNSWLAEKSRDGWKYGPIKDAEKKEHPCFVPYEDLPVDQRLKDYLFAGVVQAFFRCESKEQKSNG
jgi:hypothetical protein